jgi:hypothetical protein
MSDGRATSNRVRWFWLLRHFGVWRTLRWFLSADFRKGWRHEP